MRSVAQRFGEWASASRTFSAIAVLIAVVQRELLDCLSSILVHGIYSCLPAQIVVDCSYFLAVKASPPDVDMARLVALRYGGESASTLGVLCAGTSTVCRLFSVVWP